MDYSVEGYINRQTTEQLKEMVEMIREEQKESFSYMIPYILQVIAQREKQEDQ